MGSMKTNFELSNTIEAIYTGGDVELSQDEGSCLYCTCGDTINEIDVITGGVNAKFKDDDDEVTSFAISPDNSMLVSASKSLLLHKFSTLDKTCIDRWKSAHKTPILSMSFDQSSTLIATGSSDSTVKVYDSIKKYCTHNFKGAQSSVSLVKFHPKTDKLVLFSAYADGKIRMWDLKTSKCLCILEGHFSAVTSLIFSSDHSMVSAGRDKVLIAWDLHQRKQVKTVPVYESIESLSVLPMKDGDEQEFFVSVGETGYLRKWNLPNVQCVYADQGYKDASQGKINKSSALTHLFYNDFTDQFIAVTYDHNIVFYDTKTLRAKKQFIGYYDEIVDIKLFGVDQEYVAVASNSEQIKIINSKTATSEILCAHTGAILSLDVSYDDKYIAVSSKDNTVSVWYKSSDTDQFSCVATGKGHTHHVGCVSWPKKSTDYLISGGKDLTVKCWILPQMIIKTENIDLSVKWTENAHNKDINAVSVSPNDKLLVSASQDKVAKIWKMKSGRFIGELRGHKRGIWCAEFSPVDQCIATGSVDGSIKLWALSNFTCVKTFEGHTNSVLQVHFINRGMQLISSGSEGLIKVWSIRDDECVTTVEGHDDKVWALAVSKSEEIIVSAGSDSTIKFWRDVTEQTIAKQEKEEEDKLLKEQEMMNLIQRKQFDKAVELAIMLNHPRKALTVFKQILDEDNGQNVLHGVVTRLFRDNLENLLLYLCEWNTNALNSFISQSILSMILKARLSDELLELPKIKEIIESLLPYSERHYDRVNRLVHQSMFINYSWESMKLPTVILPDDVSISTTIE